MWVLFLALLLPGTAFAAAPDYSALISGIDVSGVITAILSAANVLLGVYVFVKGARLILSFFGGPDDESFLKYGYFDDDGSYHER